jgi:hypothetical protein
VKGLKKVNCSKLRNIPKSVTEVIQGMHKDEGLEAVTV